MAETALTSISEPSQALDRRQTQTQQAGDEHSFQNLFYSHAFTDTGRIPEQLAEVGKHSPPSLRSSPGDHLWFCRFHNWQVWDLVSPEEGLGTPLNGRSQYKSQKFGPRNQNRGRMRIMYETKRCSYILGGRSSLKSLSLGISSLLLQWLLAQVWMVTGGRSYMENSVSMHHRL